MNPRTEKRRHGRYAWAELGDRLILTLVLAGIACSSCIRSFRWWPPAFQGRPFHPGILQELASGRSLKLIRNSLWVSSLSSILTTAAAFFIALAATQPREGSGGF